MRFIAAVPDLTFRLKNYPTFSKSMDRQIWLLGVLQRLESRLPEFD
jgi:hypothetical protein